MFSFIIRDGYRLDTVGQIGKGLHGTAFEHNGVKTGPAICYEGLYGDFYG